MVTMRFLLESCLEIGLSAIICVLMIDDSTFKDAWESVSTISAILSLVGLLIAPIIFLRLTRSFHEELKETKDDA